MCRYFQDMALGEGVALETKGHCVGPAEGETDCYRALAASKPGGNRTGGQGIPSNPSKRQWTPPHPDRAVTEALGDNIREGAGEGPCPDRCRPIVSK